MSPEAKKRPASRDPEGDTYAKIRDRPEESVTINDYLKL
jgi:hypothetical protein